MPDPRPAFSYPEEIRATVGPGHGATKLMEDMGIEFGVEHLINAEELWKLVQFFDVQIRHTKPPRKPQRNVGTGAPAKTWIMISKKGEGFNQR